MAESKKFFLGIGGQQSGPYSEKEVLDKIASGEARPDTLVWYEGLGEWQRVDTIAYFQKAFKKDTGGEGGGPRKAAGEEPLRPIFSSNEAVFHRRRGPRPQVLAIGLGMVAFASLAAWYLMEEEGSMQLPRDTAFTRSAPTTRPARLAKADSDFLLNPTVVPPEFMKLLTEDRTDDVAKKAATQLENILRKKRRMREMADLFVFMGRPADAVEPYLEEKAYDAAERAAAEAWQKSTDPQVKRKMLMKSIELLTGPLKNTAAAIPRIQALEKEFPNQPHPYAYYTLSAEKKLADVFERISFFFVESLIAHMKSDFPQVRLAGRPVVSVIKEGNNQYRVAGIYKGDVSLNTDRLKNIKFEYWLVANEWTLVGTNLTEERQSWAKNNRGRQRDTAVPGEQLLSYFEGVMRAQFPTLGLHEKIGREEMASAARETAKK